MKLKQITIDFKDLQTNLDKYGDKIKFMFYLPNSLTKSKPNQFLLIVDESK